MENRTAHQNFANTIWTNYSVWEFKIYFEMIIEFILIHLIIYIYFKIAWKSIKLYYIFDVCRDIWIFIRIDCMYLLVINYKIMEINCQ